MKRMIKMGLILAGIIAVLPDCMAVGVAVPLGVDSTCTSGTGENNAYDWRAFCQLNSGTPRPSVLVRGVGFCASNTGLTIGDTLETGLTMESGSNASCFCRMISPWVSQWVFRARYGGTSAESSCHMNCAKQCSNAMMTTSTSGYNYTVKSALLNSMNWQYD